MRSGVDRVRRSADALARDLGLRAYRPERRSTGQWSDGYRSGALDFYGSLDELGRYSVIAGYIGWLARGSSTGRVDVLDVGCGTGLLRERLADQHLGRYTGIDPSDVAIGRARARTHDRTSFLIGDLGSTSVPTADVVVLNEVLYYVADLDGFVDTVRPVLSTGGALVVSMWRHPGDRSLWRALDRAWPLVDRVEVRNRANPVNRRGWRVACYRP